jgi:EAL domain-containing protein (putative c-di-GMP-specific phosphodiesterase class I)/PleD family two-component response regulator
MLQQFGQRLSVAVRKSDTIGRLGGDEFALILPELKDAAEAGLVARKLLNALKSPFLIAGNEVFCTASMGIAIYPEDAGDAEALLGHADAAMYRAKQLGSDSFQFFTSAMNEHALERLQLDSELRQALARGEFEVYYQPKVSCRSGMIVGAEALLRWNHPSRGIVSPAEFIPVLEEINLIEEVGTWVLNESCRQLRQWADAGLELPVVAVNLSARQLDRGELVTKVRAALDLYAIRPDRLELELTEGLLMRNVEQVVRTLAELRQLGVKLSVDDFGTGYSSLSYLKQFPLDSVKVDRSFVQDITADPDDASITRAVITMAHQLKLKVVAEGVETEGQLALLVANQCDEIQGYFFSRPVPAAGMELMLREKRMLAPELIQPGKRQRTILLVDDEENILSSLRRLLRRDGYRILAANSAAEGLELLAKNPVDVIVSDQRMPEMTGVEFLRRVKTIHPHTVRIVLSGYTELQSITDAINEGAIYKFLTKPWDDEQLRANIEEAFRHKELADENRRLAHQLQVANTDLAHTNQQLQELLETKQQRILRDETMLGVIQEVLQQVPIPIVGIDNEGMVVFANEEASVELGQGMPLLGNYVAECIPEDLQALLERPPGEILLWSTGKTAYRACCRAMDDHNYAQGKLLMLVPEVRERE